MTQRPTFTITFEAHPRPHDADGSRRIRALLKAAWRCWGLKCKAVVPAKESKAEAK